MFPLNEHGLNFYMKKGKTVLNALTEIINLLVNQIFCGFFKEANFTLKLCKNGQAIIF